MDEFAAALLLQIKLGIALVTLSVDVVTGDANI